MPKPERLLCRGGWYYCRAKVPVDLREAYRPRRETKVALKTKDYREAVRLNRLRSAEIDAEFEAKRQLIRAPKLKRLTEIDARQLSRLFFRDMRQRLEQPSAPQSDAGQLQALREDETNTLLYGDYPGGSPEDLSAANALLTKYGFECQPTSGEHAYLRELVARGMLEINR